MTIYCAFQSNAFQNNAFQICLGVATGSPTYAPWFTALATHSIFSDASAYTQEWRTGVVVTTDKRLLTNINVRRTLSDEAYLTHSTDFLNMGTLRLVSDESLQTEERALTNIATIALNSDHASSTTRTVSSGGSSRKRF